MAIKKVVNVDAGDADHVGGNDWDLFVSRFEDPPTSQSYTIYISGGTYYAQNGLTKEITSNSDCGALVNTCLATMTATGGKIHFAAGVYNIVTQITIPQHNGASIMFEGEGWRNTTLTWTGSADASKYIVESFSTGAADWQAITFKDIQFSGGPATNDRRVHGLHLGRTVGTSVANYEFYSVRVRSCVSPEVKAEYIQDSYWYHFYCESTGSTPAGIIDLEISNSSHIHLMGCWLGNVTVDQSRLQSFGGGYTTLEYKAVANYNSVISGCIL